jgi:hypothetical protein
MCFYRENQLFAKRNFSKLVQIDKAIPQEASIQAKTPSKEDQIEDQLEKKKKMLDSKAPGLFEHLFMLSQDEQSTEAGSDMTSDSESEEKKEHEPTHSPISLLQSDYSSEMSALIRAKPFIGDHELLPLPQPEYMKMNTTLATETFEKIQRQRILTLMTENTMTLNSIIAGQDNFEKKIQNSINELKGFKLEIGEGSRSQIEKIEQIKEQKKKFRDNLILTHLHLPFSNTSSTDPIFTDMN